MKRILACLLLLASPAVADRRIELRYYDPDRVFTIEGHKAVQTMIEFGMDEHIENIALGDANAWQVTPNKRANLIFIKPLLARARTNMTVVTDKRRYLFDLSNGGAHGRTLYSMRFVYPEEPKPAPLAVTEPEAKAPPPPAPEINTNWQAKGDKKLIPARIYDDGASTYIAWGDTTELPAILTLGTDGSEGAVNFTVKGDYLVVDGVAARYVLRIGKASAIVTNLAPRAAKPIAPPDATKPEAAK